MHARVRKNTLKKEKPQNPETFTPNLKENLQAQPLQACRLTSQTAGTKQHIGVALGDKQALSPSCVIKTQRSEGSAWSLVGSPGTHVFEDLLQAGHAEDGDPDGHHGAQEVAVLQGVVVHDAQHGHARLVARVVELQPGTQAKVSRSPAAPRGSLGRAGRRRLSPQAGSLLQWLQDAPNHCGIMESR